MDEKLKEALREMEMAHAAIWLHYDPTMDRGDKDQPKEVKAALKRMREASARLGYRFDGF